MEDRRSWLVKDEAILSDLVQLMDLTAAEKAVLAQLQENARQVSPALSQAFYQRLLAHPLTAEYFTGPIEERQKTLEQWFVELFRGEYDQTYVQHRLKIGQIHVRIGLPIRYPLAMLDLIDSFGMQVAAQSEQPAVAAAAFRKLLALDIALFNQAYEDEQLKHLAQTVGNERLARRLLQRK